ncbi:MAG: T9SS type A sorting domain-containing protein [Bacteroidia bacterium]|nr:T9SS type A sorting domain-containing protein [Bacteroidia bacterium]
MQKIKNLLYLLSISINTTVLFAQTTFTCSNTTTACACPPGAKGEYYSGYYADVQTYFTSNAPGLTRTDNVINFNADNIWGAIVPPAGGTLTNPDLYSARWTGSIFIQTAGTYTFYLTSDDASWMWMGSNALVTNPTAATAFINNGGLHSPLTISAVGIFPVCRMPFKIHFGENGGQNRAVLEYESAALGIPRQVVPQSAYCSCQMSVLPIELKHFFATVNSDDILIEWVTASEMNNNFFTVFKSADGLNWSSIAEVKGAGNNSSIKEYSVLDTSPNAGINYYYLMQTDHNGNTKKFNMIFADFGNKEGSINLFPNPFNDKVVITSMSEFSDTILEVYDVMGKKVNIPFQKQNNFRIELNTSELPKGTYAIKIINLQKVVIKKLLKV